MNNKQRIILILGIFIILFSVALWAISGFEIFTKTQVLVDVKDELFGTTYKEWVDKFIWGLDLSLAISAATTFFCSILIVFMRSKENRK